MAIKKEDLTKLEKSLHLEEGTLTGAMESEEEVSIDLPDLVIRKKEDHDTYIENLKTEQKTAGVEMAVKAARETHGLDFEGKTIDNLLTAFGAKTVEEKKAELGEPNAKIEELQNEKTQLQSTIATLKEENTKLQSTMVQKEQSLELDQKIMSAMPENLSIPKADAVALFKLKHDVSFGENKELIIKKDGQQLKNDVLEPLSLSDVVTDFSNPFLQKAEGGNGGGDEPPESKAGTLEAFNKEMEGKGHQVGSEAYNKEMNVRIGNKTLTV